MTLISITAHHPLQLHSEAVKQRPLPNPIQPCIRKSENPGKQFNGFVRVSLCECIGSTGDDPNDSCRVYGRIRYLKLFLDVKASVFRAASATRQYGKRPIMK